MRFLRAFWPLAFLIPMTWWADRGCSVAGVDPLYHAMVWVHERLGWFVATLAVVSAAVVAVKIAVARGRLRRLLALSEPLPPRVLHAFQGAARDLGVPAPAMAYLDIGAPVATTVYGPLVLLSRGFVSPLSDAELHLLARHELVHASERHARTGAVLHLLFAALLVPGFESLERRLHAARERRANLIAAQGAEDAYFALASKLQGSTLCSDVQLGLEPPSERRVDRWLIWLAPAAVVLLAVALPVSHAAFKRSLPYLLSHHC